jgi:hypothetical protein
MKVTQRLEKETVQMGLGVMLTRMLRTLIYHTARMIMTDVLLLC